MSRAWDRAFFVFCAVCFVLLLHSFNGYLECRHKKGTELGSNAVPAETKHDVRSGAAHPSNLRLVTPAAAKQQPKKQGDTDQHDTSTAQNGPKQDHVDKEPTVTDSTKLKQALQQKADNGNGIVMLSIVDRSVVYDAVNLYLSSILRLQVNNHLFLCLDSQTVLEMEFFNIYCFPYYEFININDYTSANVQAHINRLDNGLLYNNSGDPGDFGTQKYYDITNVKSRVTLSALSMRFTLLMVDVDVCFFQNPTKLLSELCDGCDMMSQMDSFMHNSGFIFVSPTNKSINVYRTAYDLYLEYRSGNDQTYLKRAIDRMKGTSTFLIRELDRNVYASGKVFFETGQRHFDQQTPEDAKSRNGKDVVMFHNNYLGSTAAKRYRLRETMLWYPDINPSVSQPKQALGYYTDKNVKYLIYDNIKFFGDATLFEERQALRNALLLSSIIDRVVILPQFHCCVCLRKSGAKCDKHQNKCSLLNVAKLKTFDKHFGMLYREHSFVYKRDTVFNGSGVPNNVPIISLDYNTTLDTSQVGMITHEFKGNLADEREVVDYFSQFNEQLIIKVTPMYDKKIKYFSSDMQFAFDRNILEAFECVSYEQWEQRDQWV